MPTFYATHSPDSNPGSHANLLRAAAPTPAAVSQLAQGLVYHYTADEQFLGWKVPPERMGEIDTRQIEKMLERIIQMDASPLTKSRAYEKRLVGCCRDFSLLACAALREQGIPARLRYGFAGYFEAGYWVDHVVVEMWNGERWQRFDPELPPSEKWGFNTLDMPENVFTTGGRAWQMCREEGADPARFGLGSGMPDVKGWWFIHHRMHLDIAALNKVELLCWDSWSYIEEPNDLSDDELAVLDEAAALSLNPDSTALRAFTAQHTPLQVPDAVYCYSPANGPSHVKIR